MSTSPQLKATLMTGPTLTIPRNRGVLFQTILSEACFQDLTRNRNLRSKTWWFTEFCNSHYVSHFAAFFIVTRAKISIAKSCNNITSLSYFSLENPWKNKNKVNKIRTPFGAWWDFQITGERRSPRRVIWAQDTVLLSREDNHCVTVSSHHLITSKRPLTLSRVFQS